MNTETHPSQGSLIPTKHDLRPWSASFGTWRAAGNIAAGLNLPGLAAQLEESRLWVEILEDLEVGR